MIKVTCKQHKTDDSAFNEEKLEKMVSDTAFGRSSAGRAEAIANASNSSSTSTGTGSGSCAGGAAGV
ncbi:hypothetical protein [Vibrio penaeicida]|uniref:SMP domain-containing protein n=1 Tax=Vibrio penaeicida TaxID=104609 RepID=A0AAV5NZY0_9VIBR|nr:hypothetical protein [Vibrio penaeicida]RTZ24001.1 hypothetical protein EKN09_05975 [Vibrio penaeicida]GLQ75927.1 hypothetical protein GCM10007932_52900 [Vibrio penaeicida]